MFVLDTYVLYSRRNFGRLSTLGSYFLLAAAPAFGQTGQISGVVNDPNHAVIAGASVKLENLEAKSAATALTNPQGAYSFSGAAAGSYRITVEAAGFSTSEAAGITIANGESVTQILISRSPGTHNSP